MRTALANENLAPITGAGAEVVGASEASPRGASRGGSARRPFWTWWGVFSLGALAGTALIGASYRQAIVTGRPSYLMFWAGVFVFMLPAAAFVIRARSRRSGLMTVLVTSGLFLYIPKILRSPFGPVYHDELAHWRQVQDIALSGHLFVPNTTIPIIQSYPGIHIVTLTVQEISGMSTWSSAMTLLALFHIIDLLAVFLIVEGFTRSSRTGALGALIYSLNSSFMYFDTQFAYESLGVMLFLMTLLAVQRTEGADSRRAQVAWGCLAITSGAACAVTHHLSTLCLCLVLVGWSLVALIRSSRGSDSARAARAVVTVTAGVVAFFAAWVAFVAPASVAYLQPYLRQGLSQLAHLAGGGHGGRPLFGPSLLAGPATPRYEEIAAFTSPLLALVATGLTVRFIRRRRGDASPSRRPKLRSGWVAIFLFGLLYFPSIPFLLAPSGAEGARRTWAFSYLGVALILAPTIARWLPKARVVGHAWIRRAVLTGAFVVVLVGNVAAGLNASYRFSGPYAVGSSTGSQTPQLAALSRWFPATVGLNNRVVADSFTGLELGAFGRQLLDAPSAGFPTFQLWLNRSAPSPTLLEELSTSNYRYLVIDKQMDLPVSELAGFFNYSSAVSSDGTTVVTPQDLSRFADYGWLTRVYDSTDFAVYRFQYGSLGRAVGRP